jgi:hypothetical protein
LPHCATRFERLMARAPMTHRRLRKSPLNARYVGFERLCGHKTSPRHSK